MKIGIITHYYKSQNYGGNLQAYALCEFLKQKGYNAEQICFEVLKERKERRTFSIKTLIRLGLKLPIRIAKLLEDFLHGVSKKKIKAFWEFNDKRIPHSKEVYNSTTIVKCINNYDVFITGSDQVWNFDWYQSAYFLDFVPSNKFKMSYAASLGKGILNQEEKELLTNSLMDYKGVSVREENMTELLAGISPIAPVWCLDPTLLLSASDWENVCEEIYYSDYVFAYFLGNNSIARRLAYKFARQHDYKLVSIPHAGQGINVCDIFMRGKKTYDASPEKFLSLIKGAKYVFTDSFHAALFSIMFKKQFFVFNRDKNNAMQDRIISLLNIFDLNLRFCDMEKEKLMSYLTGCKIIDYSILSKEKFNKLKETSKQYLIDNLQKAQLSDK